MAPRARVVPLGSDRDGARFWLLKCGGALAAAARGERGRRGRGRRKSGEGEGGRRARRRRRRGGGCGRSDRRLEEAAPGALRLAPRGPLLPRGRGGRPVGDGPGARGGRRGPRRARLPRGPAPGGAVPAVWDPDGGGGCARGGEGRGRGGERRRRRSRCRRRCCCACCCRDDD